MNKILFIVAAVILCSCSKEQSIVINNVGEKKDISFYNANHDRMGYDPTPFVFIKNKENKPVTYVPDSIKEGYYYVGKNSKLFYFRKGMGLVITNDNQNATAKTHTYMNKLSDLHYRHSIHKVNNEIRTTSFSEHCKLVDSYFERHYKFLNEITDKRLKEIETYHINLSNAMLKLMYARYNTKLSFNEEFMSLFNKIKFDKSYYTMFPKWKDWLDLYFNILKQKDNLTNSQKDDFSFQLKHIKDPDIKKAWIWKQIAHVPSYDDNVYKNLLIAQNILTDKSKLSKINKSLKLVSKCLKGKPAYQFEFKDLKGKKVKLSDFRGKYVYLDFWGVYCPACIKQIPYLNKMEHQFKNKDIQFISICMTDKSKKWKNLVNKNKIRGLNLITGKDYAISDFYNIRFIPRYVLIDKQGNILNSSAPRPSDTELESLLNNLL